MKEIKLASESKLFDFFYDYDVKYNIPHTAYLRFVVADGLYIGQQHLLRIKFAYGDNERYTFPKNPPLVEFMTPIFHANISQEGIICLNVLKQEKWSPLYNMEHIFNSIILLLNEPNVNSPLNGDAARSYVKKDTFAKHVIAVYEQISSVRYAQVVELLNASEFASRL